LADLRSGARHLRFSGPGGRGASMSAASTIRPATRLEDAGFDTFTYGDTAWREVYSTLALCACATKSILLGPGVTNPSTRHPFVTAASVATLDEISDGRAVLGLGLGQSGNALAGVPQAKLGDLRTAIRIISSAHRRARSFERWPAGLEIDEQVAELQWVTRRVPIWVAAGFPEGLRVAAELADGVMLRAGDVDWRELPDRIGLLREWRAGSARAGDPFTVQVLLMSHVTDSLEQGRRMLGGLVSARARTSTREHQLPADLRDAWRAYRANYDYTHHASAENPVNIRLMESLGLADYFYDRYSGIGSEDVLLSKLDEVERAGVDEIRIGGPLDRSAEVVRRYREQPPAGAGGE
jgi:5,10-methylenetetrahydromethanopterin reductase